MLLNETAKKPKERETYSVNKWRAQEVPGKRLVLYGLQKLRTLAVGYDRK